MESLEIDRKATMEKFKALCGGTYTWDEAAAAADAIYHGILNNMVEAHNTNHLEQLPADELRVVCFLVRDLIILEIEDHLF